MLTDNLLLTPHKRRSMIVLGASLLTHASSGAKCGVENQLIPEADFRSKPGSAKVECGIIRNVADLNMILSIYEAHTAWDVGSSKENAFNSKKFDFKNRTIIYFYYTLSSPCYRFDVLNAKSSGCIINIEYKINPKIEGFMACAAAVVPRITLYSVRRSDFSIAFTQT